MAWLSWSDRTKKKRMLYIMEERKITRMLFMDFFYCLAEVFYSFKELSSLSYFLSSVIVIQQRHTKSPRSLFCDIRKRSERREHR